MKKRKVTFELMIEITLLMGWVVNLQNSIVWMFVSDDSDKWFSRMSMSLICLGLYGIVSRLNKVITL
jgi:hypothetical protein